ncbi:MAG: SH3 domain-containing protein, partial [Chloroflexota bacterium]
PNPERTVDGFRYTVLDSASNRVGGGLVCISITDIVMQVPPTQTAEVGVPRVIPGVAVQDLRNPNSNGNVQVRLTVNNGTLQVDPNLVNQGAVDFDPTASDECLDIINQSETAAADDTIETMRSTGAQFQRMSFQMATVTAEGNGTANLELEGPRLDVNLVLTTLIYTPFAEGVDILNIFAVDTVDGGLAFGSVTIIVGAQVDNVAVTNDDRDNAVVGPVPGSDTSLTIPLGPMTLFEISQLPNTIIRGEAPAGTVTDGDVFVRVVATNGTFRVEPAQIGDQFLLEQGVFNGAEVFGLTVTGATVPALNGTVSVCLRGFGDFYYRDVTGMPRVTVALPTTTDNGFTCAEIPNSGTIVLVSNGQAPPPVQPQTVPAAQVATLPDGCMVTTNAIINLREGPGTSNTIIRPIPYDVTLTAFEQSGNWYYVDYLGLRGWLSATYVTPDDIC